MDCRRKLRKPFVCPGEELRSPQILFVLGVKTTELLGWRPVIVSQLQQCCFCFCFLQFILARLSLPAAGGGVCHHSVGCSEGRRGNSKEGGSINTAQGLDQYFVKAETLTRRVARGSVKFHELQRRLMDHNINHGNFIRTDFVVDFRSSDLRKMPSRQRTLLQMICRKRVENTSRMSFVQRWQKGSALLFFGFKVESLGGSRLNSRDRWDVAGAASAGARAGGHVSQPVFLNWWVTASFAVPPFYGFKTYLRL